MKVNYLIVINDLVNNDKNKDTVKSLYPIFLSNLLSAQSFYILFWDYDQKKVLNKSN